MLDIRKEINIYFKRLNNAYSKFQLFKEIQLHAKNEKLQRNNAFFQEILDSLRFTFVIEVLKIVDDREDKNIFKFLNYCEQHQQDFLKELKEVYIDVNTGEKEERIIKKVDLIKDINLFRNELDKYSKKINNMKILRDKIYAHTDKKYFYGDKLLEKEERVKYQEIEEIIEILFKHLNTISIDFNQTVYGKFPSLKLELEDLLK